MIQFLILENNPRTLYIRLTKGLSLSVSVVTHFSNRQWYGYSRLQKKLQLIKLFITMIRQSIQITNKHEVDTL